MKTLIRLLAIFAGMAGISLSSLAAHADGVSCDNGHASEYYLRGILQKNSSASVGADDENSGLCIGTWAADAGDGLEVDGFFGYGMETDPGLSANLGFTGYYYTGGFDDTDEEVNLNLGYGLFGLKYSVGE